MRLPDEPRSRVGKSTQIDGVAYPIRHQHREGLALAILWHFIGYDCWKHLIGMLRGSLKISALEAFAVVPIMLVLSPHLARKP